MSSPSTTSSSESGAGRCLRVRASVPWDWVIALALAGSVDCGLRSLETAGRLRAPAGFATLSRIRGVQEAVRAAPDAKILLVGSSTVARLDALAVAEGAGLEPREVLNAALPAANTAVVAGHLGPLLLDHCRPRIVVHGLDTQSVNEHGLRRREQVTVLRDVAAATGNPVRWNLLWWSHDHLACYRHQFSLREWLLRPWRFRLPEAPRPGVQDPGTWTIADSPHVFEAEADHRFGPSAEAELRRIAALCHARGIRLVLADLPLPAAYSGYWPEGRATLDRYRVRLASVAASLALPLIPLDDGSYLPPDFTDSHHLSPQGSHRASLTLGSALRNLL